MLWRALGRVVTALRNHGRRWRSRYWKILFVLEGAGTLDHLQLGAGGHFNAPVRLGGQGSLEIGDVRRWVGGLRLGSQTLPSCCSRECLVPWSALAQVLR